MTYAARILKDSLMFMPHERHRLTTMEVTFPRIVLAEFNTHRVFSRNSASSRAIPVEKRIASIEKDPFIPEAFGKNQKGMQAGEALNGDDAHDAEAVWRSALADSVRYARALARIGVHKQLANRLIEPFCWHTVIVTATEWENYFALRCNPMAQPEIQRVSFLMKEAYDASRPDVVRPGSWHLPLLPDSFDLIEAGYTMKDMCRISVARCARVSYLLHDGTRDPEADLKLADRLAAAGHMSPFEHVARPITQEDITQRGLRSWRPFVGNFCGWMQYRKTLPNEANFGAREA